jgi:hypothetical protein
VHARHLATLRAHAPLVESGFVQKPQNISPADHRLPQTRERNHGQRAKDRVDRSPADAELGRELLAVE